MINQKPRLTDTYLLKKSDPLQTFYNQYEKYGETPKPKLTLSMVNSILHHRLTFFVVSEAEVVSLYERDRNWSLKTKASLKDAKEVLSTLEHQGIIKATFLGSIWGWMVVCPDLLSEIQQNPEERAINLNMLANI